MKNAKVFFPFIFASGVLIGFGIAKADAETIQLTKSQGIITDSKINGVWIKQQTVTIKWKQPTTRVNGVSFPFSELKKYVLFSSYPTPTATDYLPKITAVKVKRPFCTTTDYQVAAVDTKDVSSARSETLTIKTYCPN